MVKKHVHPTGFKGEETDETVFELTYNWGRESYKKGDGYAQAAIATKVMRPVITNERRAI